MAVLTGTTSHQPSVLLNTGRGTVSPKSSRLRSLRVLTGWWPRRSLPSKARADALGAAHRTPSGRWRRGQGVTNRLRRDWLATLRTKRSSSPSGRAEQRGGQFVTGCRARLLYRYDPTSDDAHSGALSRGATVSR